MNVVERQISAAATQRTSCVWEVGSRKMKGWSMTRPFEDRVELATLREDRRPGDPGREVRDREREQEDVEEDPPAPKPRVQEERHPERKHELDGHDHEDQEEREPDRVVEGRVVDHRVERAEVPVAGLVSQGEPEALDHRPHEEQAEIGDGGEDQPVGQQTLPPPRSAREHGLLGGDRSHASSFLCPGGILYFTLQGAFPLGGSGAQQGAPACRRSAGAERPAR